MNVHKLTFDVNRRTENLEKVPPCVQESGKKIQLKKKKLFDQCFVTL